MLPEEGHGSAPGVMSQWMDVLGALQLDHKDYHLPWKILWQLATSEGRELDSLGALSRVKLEWIWALIPVYLNVFICGLAAVVTVRAKAEVLLINTERDWSLLFSMHGLPQVPAIWGLKECWCSC